MDESQQKCGTCNAFKQERGKQGLCRAKPPLPILYGMQQNPALPQISPQPVIFAHFPVVEETQWCREWQLRGAS